MRGAEVGGFGDGLAVDEDLAGEDVGLSFFA